MAYKLIELSYQQLFFCLITITVKCLMFFKKELNILEELGVLNKDAESDWHEIAGLKTKCFLFKQIVCDETHYISQAGHICQHNERPFPTMRFTLHNGKRTHTLHR